MSAADPLQTQINSVITLYSNGQIQEALDSVEILTKNYPNEPLLFNISGVCYKAIGQLETAVNSFEKALAIKPDFADSHYNLGLTLQGLGQMDAALTDFSAAALKRDLHWDLAHGAAQVELFVERQREAGEANGPNEANGARIPVPNPLPHMPESG